MYIYTFHPLCFFVCFTTSGATNKHYLLSSIHTLVLEEVLDDGLKVAVPSEVNELVFNWDRVCAVTGEAGPVTVSEHDVVPIVEVWVGLTALFK